MIGEESDALAIEADAIGERSRGHVDENLAVAIGTDSAYGRVAGEADGVDVACSVARRAFDLGVNEFTSVNGVATNGTSAEKILVPKIIGRTVLTIG